MSVNLTEARAKYDAMMACTTGCGITRAGDFVNPPALEAFERFVYKNFAALLEMAEALPECAQALSVSLDVAAEAHQKWDQDMRAGKLLIALQDRTLHYRADISAMHETRARVDALLNAAVPHLCDRLPHPVELVLRLTPESAATLRAALSLVSPQTQRVQSSMEGK